MLEEENRTKPEETRLITGVAKTWRADAVAACILRGIARGTFAITPGLTITLMQRCPGLVIPALRWYCDRLVDRVGRQRQRTAALAPETGISMKQVGQTAPRRASWAAAARGVLARTTRVLALNFGTASAGTSAPQWR